MQCTRSSKRFQSVYSNVPQVKSYSNRKKNIIIVEYSCVFLLDIDTEFQAIGTYIEMNSSMTVDSQEINFDTKTKSHAIAELKLFLLKTNNLSCN